jgi:hypothetical protein
MSDDRKLEETIAYLQRDVSVAKEKITSLELQIEAERLNHREKTARGGVLNSALRQALTDAEGALGRTREFLTASPTLLQTVDSVLAHIGEVLSKPQKFEAGQRYKH